MRGYLKAGAIFAAATMLLAKAVDLVNASNHYVCNGSAKFCDLKYHQYTFASTSDSFSYNLVGDCNSPPVLGNLTFCGLYYPARNKYFQRQGGRDIIRQLRDGIREFELNTCQFADYAVSCNTIQGSRALGEDVDVSFQKMAEYMRANPGEVVTLEIEDTEAPDDIAPYIIDRLAFRFPNRIMNKPKRAWPTLGQMVQNDRRLVVFVSTPFYEALSSPPAWVIKREDFYLPSREYVDPAIGNVVGGISIVREAATDVAKVIQQFCDHPNGVLLQNRWQCLDFLLNQLAADPNRPANVVNQLAAQVSFHCLIKTYFHRIRVDFYYFGVEMRYLAFKINLAKWLMLKRNLSPENLI